jgi:hypothetical protein
MEEVTLKSVLEIAQGGGNLALMLCVFVIWKASDKLGAISERLARIESLLRINSGDKSQ